MGRSPKSEIVSHYVHTVVYWGGVSVGDDVIVLANSVVTHDVPANSIVAGIPAKVLKEKGDIRV